MDRIIRPVARQLLRPRPRYPFRIPTAHAQRLYTMGHSAPQVRFTVECGILVVTDFSVTVERPVSFHREVVH